MVSNRTMRTVKNSPRRLPAGASPHIDITSVGKALVLQGGGALGAYQAGVYAGVFERHKALDWVAGVSIGAINAALIAGNPPERRVARLREFWDMVSSGPAQRLPPGWGDRTWFNQWSATTAAMFGVPGFFTPRRSPALLLGTAAPVLSYYDTGPLKSTLERLVDFDLINDGGTRFSVGAVNVRTGNSIYFDSTSARSAPSTSWPAARCRRALRRCISTARTIGTVASSPTRRCSTCSTTIRAPSRSWCSRSICSARAARCRARSPKPWSGKRTSRIPAARA